MAPSPNGSSRPLAERVAVVTGASRGAGRGIACVLGEAGATLYVTARSARASATTEGRRETIEETAQLVLARGGRAIPVPCDHAAEGDVRTLFERIGREQGRLDILVNNVWGGYEGYGAEFQARFWKQPFAARWAGMFESGVRAHLLATYHALPLMLPQGRALIVSTVAWSQGDYLGNLFYDVSKSAIVRFMSGLAEELRPRHIAAVALAPGFMRTERVMELVKSDAAMLAFTESPEYVGRAVVALASDPDVLRHSGRALRVGDLAREYGFTDVDGRRVPPFRIDWQGCPECGGAGLAGAVECAKCHGLGRIAKHGQD
jgi:NAD(P)-dependent dehydrogenase (short-subunit alcohol dehydrogenase family)